jgi:hypothetical protein
MPRNAPGLVKQKTLYSKTVNLLLYLETKHILLLPQYCLTHWILAAQHFTNEYNSTLCCAYIKGI